MSTTDFVHLHLHTAYSLLDGAIRIRDLAAKATEYGMTSVAITDHGNMYGAIDFYQTMTRAGIKPIMGCEAYITPGDRRDRSRRLAYHLVLLARDLTGYRNLVRLSSLGFLEGHYYVPRIDYEILQQYSEGLIGLSACLGGEVASAILDGETDRAREIAGRYGEIFGKDNFYLEVQRNDMKEQDRVNRELLTISRELDLPLVATNDSHYLLREDKKAHDVLLCIQSGKTMDDPQRFKYESESLYFRSGEEMAPLFAEFPDAIANTVAIAERCNVTLDLGKPMLPDFKPPGNMTLEDYLADLSRKGLERRIQETPYEVDQSVYFERLDEELEIIKSMGFPGYFLIVSDFIRYAHENDIPVGPGRGSGAGSLVAYALRIIDLDPIPYNLLFERFLNPERVSMPDFDIDFCMNRRDEVIQYVTRKYGEDKVGQIVTFNSMKAKAVVRDVGRALNIPLAEVDRLAKLIPNVLNMTLDKALVQERKLREMVESNPRYRELFTIAGRLEGLNRHAGVHAAGVVISENPLWETVPVKREDKGEVVTQFAKVEVEEAGLVKFDFLGLKTLTVIDIAQRMVNSRKPTGEPPLAVQREPVDDPGVYELISSGQTYGVFQMESSGFQEMVKRMKPSCIQDIIAAVALYRPGPMSIIPSYIDRKHGREQVEYPHPDLEPVLKETYGLVVYQEQVMQISRIMAGFSLGYADILRRAMGKKKMEEMLRMRKIFIHGEPAMNVPGALKLGYPQKLAEDVFDLMEKFAEYGFNKSHAAGYAMLSFQTAYLKKHYPAEFMAALMTCDRDKTDKVVKAINECRNMNIEVLPPDVNSSGTDFTITREGIRFGLAAVKNVGISAVEAIIDARDSEGPYESIFGFCRRVDLKTVNRRVVESLIKCGAFDSLPGRRSQKMEALDCALEMGQKAQHDKEIGQANLFDVFAASAPVSFEDPEMPDVMEWSMQQRLECEKETLGFYVTGHPVMRVKPEMSAFCNYNSQTFASAGDRERVLFGGIVTGIKRINTKTNEQMAFATMEDLDGVIEVIVRPDLWSKKRDLLEKKSILFVEGTASSNEVQNRLVAEQFYSAEEVRRHFTRDIKVCIRYPNDGIGLVDSLHDLVSRFKGDALLHVEFSFTGDHEIRKVLVELGTEFKADPGNGFVGELSSLPGVVRLEYQRKGAGLPQNGG